MNSLNGKKILFISGGFYHYDALIKENLISKGATVYYYCSAPTTNHVLMRIYQRLDVFRNVYCNHILREICKREYDYIFMLNTARLTDKFVEDISHRYEDSFKILYCWDSLKTLPEIRKRIKYFDKVFTFDSNDVDKDSNLNHLPLFYIPTDSNFHTEIKNVFSFVGFGHSNRYEFIKKIKDYANKNSLTYNFNLYLPSILYFIRGKFITKVMKSAKINDFIYRPISKKKADQIMAESKIIIDYEVGSQTGLTMRTIECLGMKKKLITTNKNITKYDFYNENNILVVDRENPILNIEFINKPYQELDEKLYKKYSLSSWLEHMFFYEEKKNVKYYNANL